MFLYRLLKFPAGIAIKLYCRHIRINIPDYLNHDGPMLIAMNHPNSFLDAVIITTLFSHPVYSLARGDAFAKKWSAFFLKHLNILPVYRRTEGVENLTQNYQTFADCKSIFANNGIVLIFSEGRCINEWKLRPLGKGTARLALSSWEDNIPLVVLPVGINYQSFRSFGKNVVLHFGEPIEKKVLEGAENFGAAITRFNDALRGQLNHLVFHGHPKDQKFRVFFTVSIPLWQKICFCPFAVAGYLIHAPLYLPLRKLAITRAAPFEHYDSVIAGLLMILYPIYLLIIFVGIFLFWKFLPALLLAFLLIPFTAWCFIRLKQQQ